MNPLISVVIPVYNRESLIGEAIESVLSQKTSFPFEVVVSDDGSTDSTPEVAAAYGDPVRVVRSPENRGGAAARNAGILAARGEIIALLDSDDLMLPGRLENQARFLLEHPEVGLVSGAATGEVADPPEVYYAKRGLNVPRNEWVILDNPRPYVARSYFANASATTIRREILVRAGLYDETIHGAEDWELLFRVAGLTKFGLHGSWVALIRRAGGAESRRAKGIHLLASKTVTKMLATPNLTRKERLALLEHLKRSRSHALSSLWQEAGPRELRRYVREELAELAVSPLLKWWLMSWLPRPIAKLGFRLRSLRNE